MATSNTASPQELNPLKLLFADAAHEDAKRWYSQGLSFASVVPDVLLQRKGGPCGVLACLQAHIVLHMVFNNVSNPEDALVESIYETLHRASPSPTKEVILCSRQESMNKGAFNPAETLVTERFSSAEQCKPRIKQLVQAQFATEAGIMLYVLSLIHTRGPTRVREDMDDSEALMTGQFGHCGQEMLNLILTGQAASQVHDGVVEMADSGGLMLRGVTNRPRVGLLTRLEALRYCQVGSFLKNPEFPIWVIGSESHFTVLYSPDRNCDAKSAEQQAYEQGKRAFTSRDTQENGFVKTEDIDGILRELGFVPQTERDFRAMQSLITKCEMPGSEGIVIWTTFWPVVGPLLKGGKTIADVPDPAWACGSCTFINEDLQAIKCVVCDQPRPAASSASTATPANTTSWACSTCTLRNTAEDAQCQACGSSRASQLAMQETMKETEQGGRTFELIHVDGLEKMINGKLHPPKKTALKLTTVDPFLAGPGSSGFGAPFEEVLQTKWPGAVFDYGPGGGPPSIVG